MSQRLFSQIIWIGLSITWIGFQAEGARAEILRARHHTISHFMPAWGAGSSRNPSPNKGHEGWGPRFENSAPEAGSFRNTFSWTFRVDASKTPPAIFRASRLGDVEREQSWGAMPEREDYTPITAAHGRLWMFALKASLWSLYQSPLGGESAKWTPAPSESVEGVRGFFLNDRADPVLIREDGSKWMVRRGHFLGGGATLQWDDDQEVLPLEAQRLLQESKKSSQQPELVGEFDLGSQAILLAFSWKDGGGNTIHVRYRTSTGTDRAYGPWSDPLARETVQLEGRGRYFQYQVSFPQNDIDTNRSLPDLELVYTFDESDSNQLDGLREDAKPSNGGGSGGSSSGIASAGGVGGGIALGGGLGVGAIGAIGSVGSSAQANAAQSTPPANQKSSASKSSKGKQGSKDSPNASNQQDDPSLNKEKNDSEKSKPSDLQNPEEENDAPPKDNENPSEDEKTQPDSAPDRSDDPSNNNSESPQKSPQKSESQPEKSAESQPSDSPNNSNPDPNQPESQPESSPDSNPDSNPSQPKSSGESQPSSNPNTTPSDKDSSMDSGGGGAGAPGDGDGQDNGGLGNGGLGNGVGTESGSGGSPGSTKNSSGGGSGGAGSGSSPSSDESPNAGEENGSPNENPDSQNLNSQQPEQTPTPIPSEDEEPTENDAVDNKGPLDDGGPTNENADGRSQGLQEGGSGDAGLGGNGGGAGGSGGGMPGSALGDEGGEEFEYGPLNDEMEERRMPVLGDVAKGPLSPKSGSAGGVSHRVKLATVEIVGDATSVLNLAALDLQEEKRSPWWLLLLLGALLGYGGTRAYQKRRNAGTDDPNGEDESEGDWREGWIEQVESGNGWDHAMYFHPDVKNASISGGSLLLMNEAGLVCRIPLTNLFSKKGDADRPPMEKLALLGQGLSDARLLKRGKSLFVMGKDQRGYERALKIPLPTGEKQVKGKRVAYPDELETLELLESFGNTIWAVGQTEGGRKAFSAVLSNLRSGGWVEEKPPVLENGQTIAVSSGEEALIAGIPDSDPDHLWVFQQDEKRTGRWKAIAKTPCNSGRALIHAAEKRCVLIEPVRDGRSIRVNLFPRDEQGRFAARASNTVSLPHAGEFFGLEIVDGHLFLLGREEGPDGEPGPLMILESRVGELLKGQHSLAA